MGPTNTSTTPTLPAYDSQISPAYSSLDRRMNELRSLRDYYSSTLCKIDIEMESVALSLQAMEQGMKRLSQVEGPPVISGGIAGYEMAKERL